MRFVAQKRTTPEGDHFLTLSDVSTGAVVVIHPECGGTITRIALDGGSGAVDVLCANPDGDVYPERASNRENCADNLFPGRMLWPFSDRIPRGIYWFEGQDYRLPVNDPATGDAIHGALYTKTVPISKLAGSSDRAQAVLVSRFDAVEVPGYPFEVELTLTYELDAEGFVLTAQGRNLGGRPAPMAFGWHPYFTLPDAGSVDQLRIETNADSFVPVDARLLPTGGIEPMRRDVIDPAGGRNLDIAVTRQDRGPITTELRSRAYRLSIEQEGAFTFQQLFVPPSSNSIAVEPLTSATNAFNRPELGLQLLHHDQQFLARCRVRLQAVS